MIALDSPSRPLRSLALSPLDLRIIALARRKLVRGRVDFGDALRALRDAVEASIPAGRVFLLGRAPGGPIVGSILSGVGIGDAEGGVDLVRVLPDARVVRLASFAR